MTHIRAQLVLTTAALAVYGTPALGQDRGVDVSGFARSYVMMNREQPVKSASLQLIASSIALDSALAKICDDHRAHFAVLQSRDSAVRHSLEAEIAKKQGLTVQIGRLWLQSAAIGKMEQANFTTTAAAVSALLANYVVGAAVVDGGRFVFHHVPPGSYFIYGVQPRSPLLDFETHWWAPVIVGRGEVSRDISGNESGSTLYCNAY